MPDNKSISQLTTAEQTTSSDLFETAIPNGSLGYLSRKVSLDAIANFIAKALQYSDLQTEAKTLIDAINEAAQSGGGGASIEEMTQAQYNALTPEQKADGTLRAISDATTSINDIDDVNITSVADGDVLSYDSTSSKWVNKELEADAIPYDNTSSGLTATDVNTAIDEVNSNCIHLATFSWSRQIAAATQIKYYITRSHFHLPIGAKVKSCFLRENLSDSVDVGGLVYSAYVNETETNAVVGAIYNGTNTTITYPITATVFYTLT